MQFQKSGPRKGKCNTLPLRQATTARRHGLLTQLPLELLEQAALINRTLEFLKFPAPSSQITDQSTLKVRLINTSHQLQPTATQGSLNSSRERKRGLLPPDTERLAPNLERGV
jgi:hypothetical protein